MYISYPRGGGGGILLCVISGFRREFHDNCALLGCYAASSGNCLPTFQDNIAVPSSRVKMVQFLTLEDGTDILSRNVGNINYHNSLLTTEKSAVIIIPLHPNCDLGLTQCNLANG